MSSTYFFCILKHLSSCCRSLYIWYLLSVLNVPVVWFGFCCVFFICLFVFRYSTMQTSDNIESMVVLKGFIESLCPVSIWAGVALRFWRIIASFFHCLTDSVFVTVFLSILFFKLWMGVLTTDFAVLVQVLPHGISWYLCMFVSLVIKNTAAVVLQGILVGWRFDMQLLFIINIISWVSSCQHSVCLCKIKLHNNAKINVVLYCNVSVL